MFEGNEISRLRTRKLDLKEMLLLSTPEDCSNFERTELLLSKQKKVQRMAALAADNLAALAAEDPALFGARTLPLVTTTLLHLKDQEMLEHAAASLEELVATQPRLAPNHLYTLLDALVEHLANYSKKGLEEVWTPLILKILSKHPCEAYLDQALELSDPGNNMASQRLAISMLLTLVASFPDRFSEAEDVLMRCCQDLRSDMRRILASGMVDLMRLSGNKLRLLEELKELLDDEEPQVKQVALSVLAESLGQCRASDVDKSGVM